MSEIDPNTVVTKVEFTLQDIVDEFNVTLEYADRISNEFSNRFEELLIEHGWNILHVIMSEYEWETSDVE